MAVKRTTADQWFSKCVRMRTNWVCEYCNADFEHDKGALHCSHYISRSYLTTRYHPLNAFSHCYVCHDKLGGGRWGGGNAAEFAGHYDDVFTDENREFIRQLSQNQFRNHKQHIKAIAAYYRNIYKEMDQRRMDGDTGRIDFDFYDGSLELNGIIKELKR